eukprot:6179419-Pleurochrysis_carterae.AAC.5
MSVPLVCGRLRFLFAIVHLVVSAVLPYRLDLAAPRKDCRGGARPTKMMVQSLPAAASGRGNYGCTSDESARTVRVSGSKLFQSAAMRGASGNFKNLHKHTSAKKPTKTSITCETQRERFRNSAEDTTVSRSSLSRPPIPAGLSDL